MRVYLTSLTGNNTMAIQQNVGLLGGMLPIVNTTGMLPIVNTTGATTNAGPFTGQSVANPTPTYEGGARLGGGLLDIPGINYGGTGTNSITAPAIHPVVEQANNAVANVLNVPSIFSNNNSNYNTGGTPLLPYGNRDYQYGSAPLYNSPADYSIWGTPVGAPGASMPPGTAPDFGGFVPGKVTPNAPDVVGAPPVVPGDGGGDSSYAPIESSSDTDWTNPDDWVTDNIAPGDALLLNMLVPGMGTVAQVLQGLVARTNPFTGKISYVRLPWYDGSAGGGYGYTKDDISGGWDESFDDYNTGDLWAKDSSLKQIAADILGWGTATSELTPKEVDAMTEGKIKGPWEGTDVYNASLEGYREAELINAEAAELEAELAADELAAEEAATAAQAAHDAIVNDIMGTPAVTDAEGNVLEEATGITALITSEIEASSEELGSIMESLSSLVESNQSSSDEQSAALSDAIDEMSLMIGNNSDLSIQEQSDMLAELEALSASLIGADAVYDEEGNLISAATTGVLDNMLTQEQLDALGITVTDAMLTEAQLETLTNNIIGAEAVFDEEGNLISEGTGLTGIIDAEFDSSAEGLEGLMTELETLSNTNQDLTDTQLTNITDAIDEMSLAIGDNAELDIQEQADMLAQLESLSNTFAHPLADYFDAEGYNVLGEDSEGYDREGYNNGYDREGYNAQGYDYSGYDSAGYDSFGLDSDGYDADGYDELGFDLGGYDAFGYDINGYDTSGFDASGYDFSGYDSTGYDSSGYDAYGYDNTGFDVDGYDELGFDLGGYDAFGYDINGYDTYGYDASGLNTIGNTVSQQTSADSVSSGSSSVNGSDYASVDEATAVAEHGFGSDEHFAAIDAAANAGGDSGGDSGGGGSDDNDYSGPGGTDVTGATEDDYSDYDNPDDSTGPSDSGGGGGGGSSGCFIADTLVTDSTGKDKAISEYKIGDSVMSIDGKTANKVKYIEVMSWDDEYELYSPTTKLKPFITKNHPIKVEGKWVSADLDYTERNHPWIDAVDIDTPVIKKGKGIVVYNLWVDGDNTYTVNGYDTETLIGDGGVVRQGLEYGNINMEDFKNIIKSSLSSTPEVTYGMHILNMALAFITNKKANGFMLDVILGKRDFMPISLLIYSVGKTAMLLKNKDTQMKLTNKLIPQRR